MSEVEGVNMEFGVVGLGRMGGGLAIAAARKGIHVVGQDTGGIRTELAEAGVEGVKDLAGLREKLVPPRAVFLYVPAGHAVDELLEALGEVLEKGDLVVDGGNSYWGNRSGATPAWRRAAFASPISARAAAFPAPCMAPAS